MVEKIPETNPGKYKDIVVHLGGKVDPGFGCPNEFSVSLFYRDPEKEENIEIARIDSSHGYVHIHRFYRSDPEKENIDIDTWQEALEFLRDKWKIYTKRYYRNHIK